MNIYVGNLSHEITENELCREFAVFGEVVSVKIMNDKYISSGQKRCYGYVLMALKSDGAKAITELNEKKLKNRVINVVEALPLTKYVPDKHFPSTKNARFKSKTRERWK